MNLSCHCISLNLKLLPNKSINVKQQSMIIVFNFMKKQNMMVQIEIKQIQKCRSSALLRISVNRRDT